jgi:hypothetical protein
MPSFTSEAAIVPCRISPRKGRKTIRRKSTFTFTMPLPWPIRPSEHEMSEWKPTQRPILCRTLSAYLALSQSSIARALGRLKDEGGSWTTSASVTLGGS